MKMLQQRAGPIARAAQRRLVDQAATAWQRLAGVRVTTSGNAVIIEGKDLTRRWLLDPMMRFAGRVSQ